MGVPGGDRRSGQAEEVAAWRNGKAKAHAARLALRRSTHTAAKHVVRQQ